MRGEYGIVASVRYTGMGSPPLARGVQLTESNPESPMRITPACAGSTRINASREVHEEDHPRLRGEYPYGADSPGAFVGSPPLARGVQKRTKARKSRTRITPACAGSTDVCHHFNYVFQDHPRLRGEYAYVSIQSVGKAGSPPLARGVHLHRQVWGLDSGITPACAGSTLKKA